MRNRLLARSKTSGILACDIAKNAPKGAKAFPASLECNFRNGQVGVTQQRNSSLDAACEQVAVWRRPESFLE